MPKKIFNLNSSPSSEDESNPNAESQLSFNSSKETPRPKNIRRIAIGSQQIALKRKREGKKIVVGEATSQRKRKTPNQRRFKLRPSQEAAATLVNLQHADDTSSVESDYLETPYALNFGLDGKTDAYHALHGAGKEPLRPGDVIAYNHPAFVAGTAMARRTATVLQTNPGEQIPLELDDGEILPADTIIKRTHEYRKGELHSHAGMSRAIEAFRMVKARLKGPKGKLSGFQSKVQLLKSIHEQATKDMNGPLEDGWEKEESSSSSDSEQRKTPKLANRRMVSSSRPTGTRKKSPSHTSTKRLREIDTNVLHSSDSEASAFPKHPYRTSSSGKKSNVLMSSQESSQDSIDLYPIIAKGSKPKDPSSSVKHGKLQDPKPRPRSFEESTSRVSKTGAASTPNRRPLLSLTKRNSPLAQYSRSKRRDERSKASPSVSIEENRKSPTVQVDPLLETSDDDSEYARFLNSSKVKEKAQQPSEDVLTNSCDESSASPAALVPKKLTKSRKKSSSSKKKKYRSKSEVALLKNDNSDALSFSESERKSSSFRPSRLESDMPNIDEDDSSDDDRPNGRQIANCAESIDSFSQNSDPRPPSGARVSATKSTSRSAMTLNFIPTALLKQSDEYL